MPVSLRIPPEEPKKPNDPIRDRAAKLISELSERIIRGAKIRGAQTKSNEATSKRKNNPPEGGGGGEFGE